MSEAFYNTIVLLFFTVFTLLLIGLHIFFATRKRLAWGFIIPFLWSALGIWILFVRYSDEVLIYFMAGDLILFGILALIRNIKKKRLKR